MSYSTDSYIQECVHYKTPVSVYLVNGVCIRGHLTDFDEHSVKLTAGQREQIIMRRNITSIMPE